MDSMVNHYSVSKNRRDYDMYTPGGVMGHRPDYATVVYCNLIRHTYKTTPIIIGGIEASLRRLAHYDYWSNKVKRSILLDSGADLISYGMGERSMEMFRLIDQMPEGADACLSKGAVDELEEIRHGIEDLSEKLLTAMATNDHHMYDEVLTSAQTVKAMASRFESNHETRLRNQDCTVQKGVVFVEVLANIERIVAHLTNVCERAREMSDYHIVFPAAAR